MELTICHLMIGVMAVVFFLIIMLSRFHISRTYLFKKTLGVEKFALITALCCVITLLISHNLKTTITVAQLKIVPCEKPDVITRTFKVKSNISLCGCESQQTSRQFIYNRTK